MRQAGSLARKMEEEEDEEEEQEKQEKWAGLPDWVENCGKQMRRHSVWLLV